MTAKYAPMQVFEQTPLFTTYGCELTFRTKVMGGTPGGPDAMTAWMLTKNPGLDVEGIELATKVQQALEERGIAAAQPGMTIAELREIANTYVELNKTVGFKRDEYGLYLEGRCVKAGLFAGPPCA